MKAANAKTTSAKKLSIVPQSPLKLVAAETAPAKVAASKVPTPKKGLRSNE